MKLIEIRSPDFDLAMMLDSGQVFHWQKAGSGFVGTIGDVPVYVTQEDDVLKVRCGATAQPARPRRALPRIISHYFALDHPLAEICARLRSLSVPANVISQRGRLFPTPRLENNYARCQAWEQRSQIASCSLHMKGSARSQLTSGLSGF